MLLPQVQEEARFHNLSAYDEYKLLQFFDIVSQTLYHLRPILASAFWDFH